MYCIIALNFRTLDKGLKEVWQAMETPKDLGAKKSGKSKNASASLENQALRDTISASQYKLMRCEEELKKTKDQLKCLVHLVKK